VDKREEIKILDNGLQKRKTNVGMINEVILVTLQHST